MAEPDAPAADDGPRTPIAAAIESAPAVPRRGMLSDDVQYAVYLHPGALETLGDTIAPFLTPGPNGPHLVCTDIDTAGALAEMTVATVTAGGAVQRTEVMFPVGMIQLVLSIGALADGFGFRTRG